MFASEANHDVPSYPDSRPTRARTAYICLANADLSYVDEVCPCSQHCAVPHVLVLSSVLFPVT